MSTLVHRIGLLGGTFDPSFLPALAWYDPSDLTTVWQDSARTVAGAVDSPVGALDDLSGNGYHLLQGTSSRRPILRQVGDLFYLEFDGGDDYLQTAPFGVTIAQPNQVAFGGRIVNHNPNQVFDRFFDGIAGTRRHSLLAFGGSFYLNGGIEVLMPFADVDALDHVFTALFHGATSSLRIDASFPFNRDAGTRALTGFTLGAAYDGFNAFEGRIYAAVVYNGALSIAARGKLEAWLAKKSGVTL